jgi:hypothetical protein
MNTGHAGTATDVQRLTSAMSKRERMDKQDEHNHPVLLVTAPNREEIECLAHQYWVERGSPIGSPEEDWFRAEEEVTNRLRKQGNQGESRAMTQAASRSGRSKSSES